MSTYVYSCVKCAKRFEVVKPMAQSSTPEFHCDMQAERVFTAPHVIGVFEPYRSMGPDRQWIHTRQKHKDFLRRYGYEEVGNDASMAPPDISDAEFEYTREQQLKELARDHEETQKVARELAIDQESV